jgi:hypothetical protein
MKIIRLSLAAILFLCLLFAGLVFDSLVEIIWNSNPKKLSR